MIDVYVAPSSENLGGVATQVDKIIAQTKLPENVRIQVRGSVEGMRQSFKSFGLGLLLSILLVYLILMAQFASLLIRSLFCWRSLRAFPACCSSCC